MRWRERASALGDWLAAEQIINDRDLHSRIWRTALHEVPRHRFIPDRAWASPCLASGAARVIDWRADPLDWVTAIYSDYAVITQRAGGETDPTDPSEPPTCSLSAPSIAVAFLDLLKLRDHHRVLEIGTGTGWTAGVLAWRLRGEQVTSIEIDPALAETAAAALKAVGQAPVLAVADGTHGWEDGAPYDRMHVTCGIREIPQAWIEQTRPGGSIVAPWMPAIASGWGGFQLRLDVTGNGTAVGRFHGTASYMMLRSQQLTADDPGEDQAEDADHRTTRLHPRTLTDSGDGALLFLAAQLPDVAAATSNTQRRPDRTRTSTVRLRDLTGDSWACCTAGRDDSDYEVAQHGDRRLWDEIEAAYLRWVQLGRPGRERFGLTVSDEQTQLWLDSPTWS